jgi:hypothetical protein
LGVRLEIAVNLGILENLGLADTRHHESAGHQT